MYPLKRTVFEEKIHRSENPQPFSSKQEENKRSRTYDLKQADGSSPPTPNHESAIREKREEVFAEAYPFCNSKSGILGFGGREKIVYGSERREKRQKGEEERRLRWTRAGFWDWGEGCGYTPLPHRQGNLFILYSLSLLFESITRDTWMCPPSQPPACLTKWRLTTPLPVRRCWLEKNATPTTIIDTVSAIYDLGFGAYTWFVGRLYRRRRVLIRNGSSEVRKWIEMCFLFNCHSYHHFFCMFAFQDVFNSVL